MIERFGVRGTVTDGVFFTEGATLPGGTDLGAVSVELAGQNNDLRKVKAALARKVRSKGGDALVAFAYGQRVSWIGGDSWRGSGRAMRTGLAL